MSNFQRRAEEAAHIWWKPEDGDTPELFAQRVASAQPIGILTVNQWGEERIVYCRTLPPGTYELRATIDSGKEKS